MSQEVKLETENPTADPGPSAISEPGPSVKTSETEKLKDRDEMETSEEDSGDFEDDECDSDNPDDYHPVIFLDEPDDPYHEPTDVGYLVVDLGAGKNSKKMNFLKGANGDYKCPEKSCKYSTKSKYRMARHYKIHAEKQYACKLCHKKFADRDTCKNHIRTHDDRYKFRCDECRKRFSVYQQLKKHSRDKHGIELESRRAQWFWAPPGYEPPLPPLPRMNSRGKFW